jgi:hypothetical protein
MTYRHHSPWIEVGLFCSVLGLIIGALVFQVWLGVGAGIVLALAMLPRISDGVKGARRGLPWEGREFQLTFLPSRAQQFAVGLPFMLGYTVWRVVDGGWLGLAFSGPFLVGYVIWFAHVLRTEGWSGERRKAEGGPPPREG